MPKHTESAPKPSPIEIDGKTYEKGESVTISGGKYVAEAAKHLRASSTSGVAAGHYAVVSEIVAGGRKAYRALVRGVLYPVRQWGTDNEIVAKQRSPRGEGRKFRKGVGSRTSHSGGVDLSREAASTLELFIDLSGEGNRGEIVSELVVEHITPRVEKLRATRAAIEALPTDLLARLAGADEATRLKVLALLGK